MLDALWASSHSPTGKARGTLPFGLLDIFFQKSPLPSVGGDEGEGGPKGLQFVHPHPHPPPSKGEGIIGEI